MKRFHLARLSRPARLCLPAAAAVLLLLSGCGGGGDSSAGGDAPADSAVAAVYSALDPMDPTNWEIGPVIGGTSLSDGMPLHPHADPEGWAIDLPNPVRAAGSVHYVTMPTGSLAGRTKITMHYRVEAAPGVAIVPRNFPDAPSILSLYFQRDGDNWTAMGPYEAYRWYATFSSQMPVAPGGDQVIEARFDQKWTAVLTSSRDSNPTAFDAALANAGRIGFVLGGGDGYGHGVYATGPARLVVTSFKVE